MAATFIAGQKYTKGAAHINPIPGPGTVSQNRSLSNVTFGAAVEVDFTSSGGNITYLTFIAYYNEAAVLTEGDPVAIIALGNTTVTNAESAFGTTAGLPHNPTSDANFLVVPLGVPVSVPLTVALANNKLHARSSGEPLDIWIGGN
jgi:hypothetical protein